MHHGGITKCIAATIVVMIWAFACSSPPIDEQTPTPNEVARDEACGYVDRIRDSDTTADQELSEWIDPWELIRFAREYSENKHEDWTQMVFVWQHAREYTARPTTGHGVAHLEISEAWRTIERGSLEYLNALCVADQPMKTPDEWVKGCAYWHVYADDSVHNRDTTNATSDLRTAADSGNMHEELAIVTSMFLSAEKIKGFLEPTITSIQSAEQEHLSASSASTKSYLIIAALCTRQGHLTS